MSLPNLLPPLSDEERASLKDSLAKHGWWPEYPAVKDEEGNVLVGWHRLALADELQAEGVDITPVIMVKRGLSDWEKVQFAVTGDVARRHLSPKGRRELLGRLMEVHDEVLKAEAEEAKRAGNAKGGAKSSLNETQLRADAAEATKQTFNGPVTVTPPKKVDRLSEYAKMLNVSRATVARDKAALDRIDRIEAAAEQAGRSDILESLDKRGADLAGMEQELGLRADRESSGSAPQPSAPIPSIPVSEDRDAELDLLAAALQALTYKPFTAEDARVLVKRTGIPVAQITVDLMNVFRALREVEKNG